MFDNLYITQKQYIYNVNSGKLFKVSKDVKKLLSAYSGREELEKKDPIAYEQIIPFLEKITTKEIKHNYKLASSLSSLQLMV